MKLKKVLIIFSIILLVLSSVLFATESDIMPINLLEEDQAVHDDDLFYCDEKIDLVEKTIEGNVFLIAKEVILTDVNVMGSAYIIAEELKLDGFNASGSLYTISKKITAENTSLANIYSISENIVLDQETELLKNLYLIASGCEYNARTTKNVNIIGDNVRIGENANVLGTLNVFGEIKPEIPETASIGNFNFIEETLEDDVEVVSAGAKLKTAIIGVLNYVIATVVIAFVLLKLVPSVKEKVNLYKAGDLVVNGIIGLGLVVATPILIILLFVTGIFAKIGFTILWIYLLAFVISSPLAVIIIGLMVAKKLDKQEFKYVLGIIAIVAVIVSVLNLVNGISALIGIIMGIVGFGSILKLVLPKK